MNNLHNCQERDELADEIMAGTTRSLAFRALDDEDSLVRKHAIYLLSTNRDSADIDTFIHALRDPVKEVRNQATHALAILGAPASGKLIALLQDSDWKVRYRAAEALGMMKMKEAGSPLIQRLSDKNDHVRYMAVKALGELGDDDAREYIRPCLHDTNPYVRKIAARILEK